MPKQKNSISQLKDCLDALGKLKEMRRELKDKLSRQGLSDDDEVNFAKNLLKTSERIKTLEDRKLWEVDIG